MERHSYLRTHTLSAEHLLLDLSQAADELRRPGDEQDRRAVTLIRESGLSVVLTHLRAGAQLREHAAPGPATVQVLDGKVQIELGGKRLEAVGAGHLVAFDAGVRHAVTAEEDSTLLLTLAGSPEPQEVASH
jgi:quercetin dioxygenase-like cupin family protein